MPDPVLRTRAHAAPPLALRVPSAGPLEPSPPVDVAADTHGVSGHPAGAVRVLLGGQSRQSSATATSRGLSLPTLNWTFLRVVTNDAFN